METHNPLLGVLFVQILMWSFASLRHYSGENVSSNSNRLNVPNWLRRLFGDFRQRGTLSLNEVVIQSSCYIATLITLLLAYKGFLTVPVAAWICIIQFLVAGLVVILIHDVIPFLSKEKKRKG